MSEYADEIIDEQDCSDFDTSEYDDLDPAEIRWRRLAWRSKKS